MMEENIMIEVQLSTQSFTKPVVTFHANTVEFYYATSNQPYGFHVGHIKSIEVIEKRGKHYLTVSTGLRDESEQVDVEMVPKVRELVAEVKKAMEEFQSKQ
jgi:hypothetical protein